MEERFCEVCGHSASDHNVFILPHGCIQPGCLCEKLALKETEIMEQIDKLNSIQDVNVRNIVFKCAEKVLEIPIVESVEIRKEIDSPGVEYSITTYSGKYKMKRLLSTILIKMAKFDVPESEKIIFEEAIKKKMEEEK